MNCRQRWQTAATGLACIDEIAHVELKTTGFLHNHKRLWFAANLVHFENIEWWHGERLFYKYLLDGEPGPQRPILAVGGQHVCPQAILF